VRREREGIKRTKRRGGTRRSMRRRRRGVQGT
jgi:hypothetical protein